MFLLYFGLKKMSVYIYTRENVKENVIYSCEFSAPQSSVSHDP